MKIGLIFTNDWELYGDGSGNFWEVQYNPMDELISLLDLYKSKITIMAEVGQQLAYKSISGTNSEANEITLAWEKLVKNAISKNHDVQLHYHPQWVNAKYLEKWHLKNEEWAIGKLNEQEIKNIIYKGKNYLEDLIKQVKSDYKCNCFRAGAYYIEPSDKVLKILKEFKFLCDTTVTKGLTSDNYFDYTTAYSNIIPYFIDKDVKFKTNSEQKIVEFPIYSKLSFESRILKKFIPNLYTKLWNGISIPQDELDWSFKRDKLKNIRYPKENRFYKQNQKKDLKFYLNQIFSKNAIQLDYDYIFPTEFVHILKNIINEPDLKSLKNKDIILPVVASGHIKDIPNTYNMEKILKLINKEFRNDIVYWTLSDAVNYYYNNKVSFTNL